MTKKRCMVCVTEFEPCYTCEKMGLISWRNTTCCREHFIINLIIADFTRKFDTKENCKKRLNNYITEFGEVKFNDNVKPIIDEIMREDKIIKTKTDDKAVDNNFTKKSKK